MEHTTMQDSITLTLPADIKVAMDDLTRKEGISAGDFIREAIQQYLLLRQFRSLRERMLAQAEGQGIYTDQDVFDRVS